MQNLPLYDSPALAEDPTCAEAKLLFLPGKAGAPYVVIAPWRRIYQCGHCG